MLGATNSQLCERCWRISLALAVPELDKLISRYFEDPGGGARLQNAIDVLGLMETPAAHAPLVRCLDHPRDTIRASVAKTGRLIVV